MPFSTSTLYRICSESEVRTAFILSSCRDSVLRVSTVISPLIPETGEILKSANTCFMSMSKRFMASATGLSLPMAKYTLPCGNLLRISFSLMIRFSHWRITSSISTSETFISFLYPPLRSAFKWKSPQSATAWVVSVRVRRSMVISSGRYACTESMIVRSLRFPTTL